MENKPLTERERIDALVFRLGISIRQLAKIVDMNENTFYHITDNSRFGISERTASKICYNLEKKMSVVVNRQWLLTGEGDMIDEKRSVLPYDTEEEGTMMMAAEEGVEYGTDWKAKYLALLEKYTKLQEEHKELLKKMLQ
jgi:DNA-binding CsgD family transcriptional regulator